MTENEWRGFFNAHADKYDNEVFTQDTEREVAFLIEELALPRGATVIDFGCGTGRHTVELAKHGLKLTGVDISEAMLAKTKERADASRVTLNLIRADLRTFQSDTQYDALVGLCEGAIGLLGADDDPFDRDLQVLQNAYHALKPGGKMILTVLSASRLLREYSDDDVAKGVFDPITLIETSGMTTTDADGNTHPAGRERLYTPAEFTRMLRQVGFTVDNVWGGTAGDWGRRPLKLDEYEFMVVAHK